MYAWHGYAITKFSLAKLLETGHCVGFKTKKLASKKYEVRGRLLECLRVTQEVSYGIIARFLLHFCSLRCKMTCVI